MTRQDIIEKTIKVINQLPDEKAEEISDFAVFLIKKFEENRMIKNIHQLASNSKTFEFLNDEKDLYSLNDLKEKYNG